MVLYIMTNAELVYQNGPWNPTPRDIVARKAFIKRTKEGTPNIGNTVIRIPLHSYDTQPIGRLQPSAYATASITHRSIYDNSRRQPQTGRRSLQRLKSKTRPEDNPPDAMDMINEYNKTIDTAMENIGSPIATQKSLAIKNLSPVKFASLAPDADGDIRPVDNLNRPRLKIVTNPDNHSQHNIGGLAEAMVNNSPGIQKDLGNTDLLKAMDAMGSFTNPKETKQKHNEIQTPLKATANSPSAPRHMSQKERDIAQINNQIERHTLDINNLAKSYMDPDQRKQKKQLLQNQIKNLKKVRKGLQTDMDTT